MWGNAADAEGLIAALRTRRSLGPDHLRLPAPSPEQLQQAAELALRAPDHHGLRPFRFVHVGSDERAALGELFARAAAERGRDAEGVEMARRRAASGPALLAVVGRIRDDIPEVPPHEQWLCIGAAVMNLINGLHLMGFSSKVLGGSAARAPLVRRAFCSGDEQLVCWVICGTPHEPPPAPPETRLRELLTDWAPPD